jgi:signal transduction histidine kinase
LLLDLEVDLYIAVAIVAVVSGLLFVVFRLRARALRAEEAERLATERRDRFLAGAAAELDAPLGTLRAELASLTARTATAERLAALVGRLDELRAIVTELARLPRTRVPAEREEIDLAELVREVVEAPPFSDRGPSVIVRARAAPVLGDRSRLLNGLRVLLWVVRRGVDELVITVSADEALARVEIDTHGNRAAVDALERLPAVAYGMRPNTAPPGTTLALDVATEVARVHGGRLRASSRAARGERFTLELPRLLPA